MRGRGGVELAATGPTIRWPLPGALPLRHGTRGPVARVRYTGAQAAAGVRPLPAEGHRLMPSGLLVDLLLIAALILVNAFFAAAEIALVSARRPRLRQLAEEGNPAARTVLSRPPSAPPVVHALRAWACDAEPPGLGRRRHKAQLLQHAEVVPGRPVRRDLPVTQPEAVQVRHRDR